MAAAAVAAPILRPTVATANRRFARQHPAFQLFRNIARYSRQSSQLESARWNAVAPRVAATQGGGAAGNGDEGSGMVEVGRISMAHGVRGELKVIPSTDFPEERFMTPGLRFIQAPMGTRKNITVPFKPVHLTGGRMMLNKGREMWLVKLKEVTSKEEADALSQFSIFVREEDRPDLEADEVYAADLIDMAVVLQETGELIGTVVDIYSGTGEYDTVRVALVPKERQTAEEAGTFLIPFTPEMVPVVDVEAKKMTVNPPEGLLEATTVTPKQEKPRRRPRRKGGAKTGGGGQVDSSSSSSRSPSQ